MNAVPAHRLRRMKRALRREVRARRDALPAEDRGAKSAAIAERVLELPELDRARTVMAFSSFGSEVDTAPLLERLVAGGRNVLLPRIEDGEVVPVPWRPGVPTRRAPFGAEEPLGPAVDPAEVQLVVTPGVVFDRAGNRTGYGGGYYDRFFKRVAPGVPKIAIAFAIQVVAEVPAANQDLRVDAIVTEDEVIRRR